MGEHYTMNKRIRFYLSGGLLFILCGCVSSMKTTDSQRSPASSCVEGATPVVSQFIYSMDLDGVDPLTGEKKSPPKVRMDVINSAGKVSCVTYFANDNTQIDLQVEGGNVVKSTVYMQFKSADSAKIFRDAMVNGTVSYLIIYDYYSSDVKLQTGAFGWLDIRASSAYVWDDSKQVIMKLGELIGSQRSVDKQGYWTQLMVKIFGRSYLNNINFVPPQSEGIRQQDI